MRKFLAIPLTAAALSISAVGVAGAAGESYTYSGCTFSANIVKNAADSSKAIGSLYASQADSDCRGVKAKLGYRSGGTNYVTSYVTDTDPYAGYYAQAERTGTPRYVIHSGKGSNNAWYGAMQVNY